MNKYIPCIELNFCNACQADCWICSKPHGSGNARIMKPEIFDIVLEQLKDITFDEIQTSGNGDALLNPWYFSYVRQLRGVFPNTKIHFYSNFLLIDEKAADIFIDEKLIDFIFTRIDTLDEYYFKLATSISSRVVFKNLEYFIKKNENIGITIGYSSIKRYYEICKKILGREPYYSPFSKIVVDNMVDEYGEVVKYFRSIPTKKEVTICRINQSLWAERVMTKANCIAECPKLGSIKNTIWISPDGSCNVCGYDDEQCKMIAGNIKDQHLWDIWTGSVRHKIISKIEHREYTDYPCVNPLCCKMYEPEEEI